MRQLDTKRSRSLRWLEHEHQEIQAQLRNLNQLINEEDDQQKDALSEGLQALEKLIRGHHSREEASDLYALYPQRFPQFHDRLVALKSEHQQLIDTISELGQLAARGQLSPERWAALIAQIQQHERSESEIIQAIPDTSTDQD